MASENSASYWNLECIKLDQNYFHNYLELRQLRLKGSASEVVGEMCPGIVSINVYHCATGFLGLSNISNQWSRPIPIKLEPIAVQPINSFDPILQKKEAYWIKY